MTRIVNDARTSRRGKLVTAFASILSLASLSSAQNLDRLSTAEILLKIFEETEGFRWKNRDGWNIDPYDFCNWHGIECYGTDEGDRATHGEIAKIDLSDNKLTGEMPQEVWDLPYLRSLILRDNPDLFISFDRVGAAEYLEHLTLSNTDIDNLNGLEDAVGLNQLHITDCALGTTIPMEIFQLTNLRGLYGNYNAFIETIPTEIGRLTKLRELYLYSNELTGVIPDEIGMLTDLTVLAISDNFLSGDIPADALNQLVNLELLALHRPDKSPTGNGLTGPLPPLDNLSQLTEVYLENQNLSGPIPTNFLWSAPKDEVVTVDLRNNELDGHIPGDSGTLSSFERMKIYLSGNKFTSMSNALCDRGDWMGGNVREFADSCDAILCPVGTWAEEGRQTSSDSFCENCPSSAYMGSMYCRADSDRTQRYILMEFYDDMDGDQWLINEGWNTDDNECTWYGITCEDGDVTEIDLSENRLSGTPRESFFNLPFLRSLNLAKNPLDFQFYGIYQAVSLQSLKLYSTGMTSLENVEQLKDTAINELVLSSNYLQGPIPDVIYELTDLEYLTLSYNNLFGPISPDIGNLQNLKAFHAYGNSLSGLLPTEFGQLKYTLQDLVLSENNFYGPIPSEFNDMEELQEFSIHQTSNSDGGLTGELPSFANCKKLTVLHLNSNSLEGVLPSDLLINSEVLDNTIDIDLSNNKFTGHVSGDWERFSRLNIDLSNNQITSVSTRLCDQDEWQDGDVGTYDCSAILCDLDEFNIYGRRAPGVPCNDCSGGNLAAYMGSTQCTEVDFDYTREVLKQLYFSTNGNSWKTRDGWMSDSDVCDWYGITCAYGDIIIIDLSDNGLTGTPSTEIFKLTELEELLLNENEIDFDFTGIEELTKLKTLSLSETQIQSIVGIGAAKSLTKLHLTSNGISGTIPQELYDLTSLEFLFMNYNAFTGRLSSKISQLSNLQELYLLHNRLTGQIPAAIGALTDLKVLALTENNFGGTLPEELNDLTSIEVLAIQREGDSSEAGMNQGDSSKRGSGISGPLLSFNELPNLKKLYLGSNSLTGTIPYDFLDGVLDKSEPIEVDLISNSLQGRVPSALTQFERLSIFLAGNKFTDLADGLCNKDKWMEGQVGSYGCDGILCPPGFFAEYGRQTDVDSKCLECAEFESSLNWGSFECISSEGKESLSERMVLETMYNMLSGPNWTLKDNWMNPDISFCEWSGITCKSNGAESVEAIHLSNNRLAGSVPADVFDLPNLEELNLAGNEISFDFRGIGSANNLQYLNVDSIGLKSLQGLDDAQGLVLLHAMYNDFDEFPTEVFSLKKLQVLYLSENNFGLEMDGDLQSLSELDKLVYFQCSNCGLQGKIPTWIDSFQELQYLSLAGNSLTGPIPTELETIESLEHLDLSDQMSRGGSGLNGVLPSFASSPILTELYLNKNNLSGPVPDDFLESVNSNDEIKIDLRTNKLSGGLPEVFSRFDKLTLLLANNEFTAIPDEYCDPSFDKPNWNGGDINANGCDGLLCEPGFYNILGRQAGGGDYGTCAECSDNESPYYGSTSCGTQDQKIYLMALYSQLGGADWIDSDNWMEGDNFCEWYGIECNDNSEVTIIDLENNGLLGDVPADLFNIETLTEINLKRNEINFSFDGIEKLENLITLKLSETGLESIEGIGKATSLQYLHLTNNLVKNIPTELYDLVNLKDLFMNYNELSGALSTEIGKMTKLENLFMFHNKITGQIPTEIGYLQDLVMLALGENMMTGPIPTELNGLPRLETIALQRENGDSASGIGGPLNNNNANALSAGLTGPLPKFDDLPKLKELYLGSNSFEGPIPSTFLAGVSDKSNPIKVDLTMNKLVGSLPLSLEDFDKMRIFLAGNEFDEMDDSFCDKNSWMNGEVDSSGCEAIMCPKGTYNAYGRKANDATVCEPCPYTYTARFYGSISCAADTTEYNEREILAKFYESTGGSNWNEADGWLEDDIPICNWHGVHCASEDNADDPEVVTKLHLPSNNLVGTVPPQIYGLQYLRMLNLRDNEIDVEFNGIGGATSLEEVYLDATKLTSLEGIGQAKGLTTLYLLNNDFKGAPIPETIYELSNLKHLQLSDGKFGGKLSSKIGNLVMLEEFYCHGNDLTGEIPSEIGNLVNLEVLVLSENNLIGTLPREINQMNSLQTLFIDSYTRRNAGISGPLPDFSGMAYLREIYLGSNSITGTIPKNLLADLESYDNNISINLRSNRIEGTLPAELSRFKKLDIDIADNLITDIDDELCEMDEWMNGGVGKFDCNAILCPASTFNQYGRQSTEENPCKPCEGSEGSTSLGATMCVHEMKEEEREILENFYKSCGGDNWKSKEGWLDPDTDICHWYGISCRNGGSVDSILLGSNNLVGTPPRSLFLMSNLKWLWLYSNPIDFKFDGIGDAGRLTSLLLDSTGLKSLDGIGAATQLTDLDVRFNSLSGPFPGAISGLINMENLSINENKFTGPVPNLTRMKKLKSLRMGDNEFTGEIPAFAVHKNLKTLDLSGNKLTGTIPSNLLDNADTEQGIFIDLSSNRLSGRVPADLDRFPKITIYVRDNFIEGIDPELCDNDKWNDGDVGNFDCDGILCPPGTYSPNTGRASRNGAQCIDCSYAKFYGQSQCINMQNSATFRANSIGVVLPVLAAWILL